MSDEINYEEARRLLDEQKEDYFQLKRDLLKELSELRLENEILRERNALLEGFKQGVEEYKEVIERVAFEAGQNSVDRFGNVTETFDDWRGNGGSDGD